MMMPFSFHLLVFMLRQCSVICWYVHTATLLQAFPLTQPWMDACGHGRQIVQKQSTIPCYAFLQRSHWVFICVHHSHSH